METNHTLIIVDDEPLAREAVSRLLEERFPDFSIAGVADSGPASVDLFRKLHPEIVIMDIRIPGFDGLEASRVILKESPDTQIIVLSAYDDFHYAQDALHDGILGYLLKPVREERLRILLDSAIDRIRKNSARARDRRDVKTYRSIAVREQVASFLYGSKGGISADDFARLSDPPIKSGYFIVIFSERDRIFTTDEIKELGSALERMNLGLIGEWMGLYLPIFIPSDESSVDSWRSEAEFLARELSHLIRTRTNTRVRVGIGPFRNNPEQFPDSFRLAFDALQEGDDPRPIIFSVPRGSISTRRDTYPVEGEKVFLTACRASNGTAALNAAGLLADDLINPEDPLMDSRFAVTEFLIVFRREWERISGEPKRQNMANIIREALLCADHVVLKDWFLLVVRDLVRNLGNDEGDDDLLLRKVKHFVNLNDLRDVSLESAAESVGLSAPYLSRLFKDKGGRHFHEYVVDIRVHAAARLLRETMMPIKDVARDVGYSDVAYFGRLFRKKFGSTPRDYRNSD
jgi:two-component system response regulator YesN